jgi:hypothetical protein
MALISRFEERPIEPTRIHDEVVCGFKAANVGGRRILQLETDGSPSRKIPGKVSQSIQIDEAGARELNQILTRSFPSLT